MPEYLAKMARGEIDTYTLVHKFGRNTAVGTSIVPVCEGGFYRMPQMSATVTLAVISDDADDTAAGAGAQEVTLEYLDSTGAEQTGTIATNGITESTETIAGVWRLLRAYVSGSGTYADQTVNSQQGTITIRQASAGITWAVIPEIGTTGFAIAQSLIGCYTVPLGKRAYMLTNTYTVDSNKSGTCYLFARSNANQLVAPYSALRVKNIYTGLSGLNKFDHETNESYPALTDILTMATSPTTADISAEFELMVVDDD
jgi:hypothetical protein